MGQGTGIQPNPRGEPAQSVVDLMRTISTFLRDETGAVTIEFILWVPVFVGLLVFVTDASIIYLTHSEMWSVARDTARRMTTARFSGVSLRSDMIGAGSSFKIL